MANGALSLWWILEPLIGMRFSAFTNRDQDDTYTVLPGPTVLLSNVSSTRVTFRPLPITCCSAKSASTIGGTASDGRSEEALRLSVERTSKATISLEPCEQPPTVTLLQGLATIQPLSTICLAPSSREARERGHCWDGRASRRRLCRDQDYRLAWWLPSPVLRERDLATTGIWSVATG